MSTHHIKANDLKGIERELKRVFRRDSAARRQRIRSAVLKAARRTKRHVADHTIPIAFKELVDSLSVTQLLEGRGAGARLSADAPHAAATEVGSRPHTPPLAPLIAWVKLRGMQGLTKTGRSSSRKQRGTTTAEHAKNVAHLIRSYQSKGATPIDAPERIARAIQAAIAKLGTKPHRFMAKAIPFAQQALHEEVSDAIPDK